MWYVIQTMTGEEHHFVELCKIQIPEIEQMGRLFIPTIVTQKHYQKKWHMVKKNMFPSYVFIDTEDIDLFYKKLNAISCFSKILKTGDDIVSVTEEEKEFLQSMMDQDYCVNYSQGFLIGNEVVVTEGALINQRGRIRKIDRHRRIAELEISLFSRPTKVEVGFGAFAKVSEEEWEEIRQEHMDRQRENVERAEEGQQIQVKTGVFEGMRGKVLGWKCGGRQCQVEMNIFGAATKVLFQREEIQVV